MIPEGLAISSKWQSAGANDTSSWSLYYFAARLDCFWLILHEGASIDDFDVGYPYLAEQILTVGLNPGEVLYVRKRFSIKNILTRLSFWKFIGIGAIKFFTAFQ